MKKRFFILPALLILAACGQAPETKGPDLPRDVPGATQPFTSEAAGKPVLQVYQVNPDGSSQELLVPGLTQQAESPLAMPDIKGMVITAEGFNPSSLTFKTGTKLIIQNSDAAPHQPSSDPHPLHTDCPELNAENPLGMGESYEMVLTEAKTCGMHDHLNPEMKATITVTE